jgi:hypothetical protein
MWIVDSTNKEHHIDRVGFDIRVFRARPSFFEIRQLSFQLAKHGQDLPIKEKHLAHVSEGRLPSSVSLRGLVSPVFYFTLSPLLAPWPPPYSITHLTLGQN